MNPLLSEKVVARAYERDPAAALAEYGAEFRTDIEAFVSREAIDAATVPGRLELPPIRNELGYVAFVDPSGGAQDAMTLAIAHLEGEIAVLDALREVWPPFSPDAVVESFVELLNAYNLNDVSGDRYGGQFVQEQFGKRGIAYKPSERNKSDIYKEMLQLLNSRRVELLDNPKFATQLAGLERRTARGGRDSVDHMPGGHDDIANSACGACVLAAGLAPGNINVAEFIKAYS